MTEVAKVTGALDSGVVLVRFKNGHRMIGVVPRRLIGLAAVGVVLVMVAPVDLSKGVIQLTK